MVMLEKAWDCSIFNAPSKMQIDYWQIFDNKLISAIIYGAIGALLGRLLGRLKDRVQVLEYTALHDRVATSMNDPVFGEVKSTWNGTELSNLFNSTVTISNTAMKDLKDVTINIYTGSTRLLNQQVSIKGTTCFPQYTEAYAMAIHVPSGEQATAQQLNKYLTNREYKIPVWNRGQTAVFQYLTSETTPNATPSVWLEIHHEGLQAVYKQTVPEVFGIPIKHASIVGLLSSAVVLVAVICLGLPAWVAAAISMAFGLSSMLIGAWLWKFAKGVFRFFSS